MITIPKTTVILTFHICAYVYRIRCLIVSENPWYLINFAAWMFYSIALITVNFFLLLVYLQIPQESPAYTQIWTRSIITKRSPSHKREENTFLVRDSKKFLINNSSGYFSGRSLWKRPVGFQLFANPLPTRLSIARNRTRAYNVHLNK